MIRSFRHKGLRKLFEEGATRGIEAIYAQKMRRILASLQSAASPDDMDKPGYKLHPLKGDKKGFWSVSVAANWRIVFEFDGIDVINVDLIDYH